MKYYMNEMRWPEFAARKDDIIILPVGSTEQHAQHLPLSTDAVIAEKFALALAKEVNGIVMPTMSYGYKSKPLSGGGPLFPGTIDLNGETVIRMAHDILLEVVRDGFKKICEPKFNSTLSDSQLRVMELCYYGKKDEEIAETLFISLKTVETHIYNIFRKTGVSNRVQLARALLSRSQG